MDYLNRYSQVTAKIETITAHYVANLCQKFGDEIDESLETLIEVRSDFLDHEIELSQVIWDKVERILRRNDGFDVSDAARELAMSVEVRSGWRYLNEANEDREFRILLCNGPTIYLRGTVDECFQGPRYTHLETSEDGGADIYPHYHVWSREIVSCQSIVRRAFDWFTNLFYLSSVGIGNVTVDQYWPYNF